MKKLIAWVLTIAVVIVLSEVNTQAGVYRARAKASCSGVSRSKVYSRGKASCSGVSKVRARRSCAG